MLKKLKRKFILVNMAFVGAVLLCVFAAVCTTNYGSLKFEVERSLQMAVEPRGGSTPKPQIGGEKGGEMKPKFTAVYAVLVDESGAVVRTLQTSMATMEEDVLTQAVSRAVSAGEEQGVFSDLGLYYRKNMTSEGLKIAFADTGTVWDSMRQLMLASLLIGLCAMIAFYFISRFLARWALRPVEKAWSQQRQFVADASHELKTPLTVILANNNILLSHTSDSIAKQKKWVESTGEEAEHMRKLVDDLLFLAKSDAVETQRVMAKLDLSELIWTIFLQFEPIAYEKEISMDSDIAADIKMQGDLTQIRQLAHILLDNACKYAGRGGSVFLSLSKQDNTIALSVQNSGSVIPQEELPHVFERFYRSDKARGSGGFGLGLAIAQSIAQGHCGSITAQSEAKTGTAFTVKIPAYAEKSKLTF